jgi:RNA polymerase sigma factor (sigma-70 family)
MKLRAQRTTVQVREVSVDDDADDDGPLPAESFVDTEQAEVGASLEDDQQRSAFWKCLDACRALNDRARRLLMMLFKQSMTLGQIAQLWSVTANHVYQMFFQAKKKLKNDEAFLRCLNEIGGLM